MQSESLVYVIDPEPATRSALKALLKTVGLQAQLFSHPLDFRKAQRSNNLSCLILEVRLPQINGLDLQRELNAANDKIPMIFLTAHGDIRMSVQAMKAGAVNFLSKPYRDQDLLDAVHDALDVDRIRRARENRIAGLRHSFSNLTPRERELLSWVVSGRPNKEIAAELGMSEITVKVHRGNVMRKMQAETFADLVRMAAELRISHNRPAHTSVYGFIREDNVHETFVSGSF